VFPDYLRYLIYVDDMASNEAEKKAFTGGCHCGYVPEDLALELIDCMHTSTVES
jgi:hypothetical protein